MTDALRIVLVDDQQFVQNTAQNIRRVSDDVVAEAFLPEEVEPDDLTRADLVLLDFDVDGWTPDDAPALQQPQDGLGFASVVRSYFRVTKHNGAVALLSDKLNDLAYGVAPFPSEHAIARLHNLEWAFHKAPDLTLPPIAERIVSLARASRQARLTWPLGDIQDERHLLSYLCLPESAPWADHAELLLSAAQPPAFELAAASQGQSVVRWLAQRVLPHPGVLLDDARVALMLNLHPAVWTDPGGAALADQLESCVYRGPLTNLVGRRWWKSGVVETIARLNGGSPIMSNDATASLRTDLGLSSADAVPAGSVLALDPVALKPKHPSLRHEVVRVRPDDWPVFADPGYVSIGDFANAPATLSDLVDPADRSLVE